MAPADDRGATLPDMLAALALMALVSATTLPVVAGALDHAGDERVAAVVLRLREVEPEDALDEAVGAVGDDVFLLDQLGNALDHFFRHLAIHLFGLTVQDRQTGFIVRSLHIDS